MKKKLSEPCKERRAQHESKNLWPYLNDGVRESAKRRIEKHLAACRSCRRELEFWKIVQKVFGQRCTDPRVGDAFILYLNGNVSAATRQRIEDHVQTCEPCRTELAFFDAGLAAKRRKKESRLT